MTVQEDLDRRTFCVFSENFRWSWNEGLFDICNAVTPSHTQIRNNLKTYTPTRYTHRPSSLTRSTPTTARTNRPTRPLPPTKKHQNTTPQPPSNTIRSQASNRLAPTRINPTSTANSKQARTTQHLQTTGPRSSSPTTSPQQLTTTSNSRATDTTNRPAVTQYPALTHHIQTSNQSPASPQLLASLMGFGRL
jgi:hypothetical protein